MKCAPGGFREQGEPRIILNGGREVRSRGGLDTRPLY